MSSRIKRRVRVGGGQYVTKIVHLAKGRPIVVPKEIPTVEAVAEAPKIPMKKVCKANPLHMADVKDIAKLKESPSTKALPVATTIVPSIVISKPETKAKRNEILKAINDTLTGKEMKPIKQKGGFLRQLF
jgi:hypothetical protein